MIFNKKLISAVVPFGEASLCFALAAAVLVTSVPCAEPSEPASGHIPIIFEAGSQEAGSRASLAPGTRFEINGDKHKVLAKAARNALNLLIEGELSLTDAVRVGALAVLGLSGILGFGWVAAAALGMAAVPTPDPRDGYTKSFTWETARKEAVEALPVTKDIKNNVLLFLEGHAPFNILSNEAHFSERRLKLLLSRIHAQYKNWENASDGRVGTYHDIGRILLADSLHKHIKEKDAMTHEVFISLRNLLSNKTASWHEAVGKIKDRGPLIDPIQEALTAVKGASYPDVIREIDGKEAGLIGDMVQNAFAELQTAIYDLLEPDSPPSGPTGIMSLLPFVLPLAALTSAFMQNWHLAASLSMAPIVIGSLGTIVGPTREAYIVAFDEVVEWLNSPDVIRQVATRLQLKLPEVSQAVSDLNLNNEKSIRFKLRKRPGRSMNPIRIYKKGKELNEAFRAAPTFAAQLEVMRYSNFLEQRELSIKLGFGDLDRRIEKFEDGSALPTQEELRVISRFFKEPVSRWHVARPSKETGSPDQLEPIAGYTMERYLEAFLDSDWTQGGPFEATRCMLIVSINSVRRAFERWGELMKKKSPELRNKFKLWDEEGRDAAKRAGWEKGGHKSAQITRQAQGASAAVSNRGAAEFLLGDSAKNRFELADIDVAILGIFQFEERLLDCGELVAELKARRFVSERGNSLNRQLVNYRIKRMNAFLSKMGKQPIASVPLLGEYDMKGDTR